MKYHINFEGKIYPCKAKVLKCPYGESRHSNHKVLLYYKLMGSHGLDAKPAESAMRELERIQRLKSLFPVSEEIEKVDYPVDVVVATLKESLAHLRSEDAEKQMTRWKNFEIDAANDVRLLHLNGKKFIPSYVPQRIRSMGLKLFMDKDNSTPRRTTEEMQEDSLNKIEERLEDRRRMFKRYDEVMEHELNHLNYHQTFAWMTADFEKFAHDLNTSKMITQPIFYGDLDKARETIKNMDNYELLATLDDYSVTDEEIEKNVKEANYFKYESRPDLTDKANEKMETWYRRNREIYESWKINSPKRILLSMEVAKELDRREIIRQDNAIGEMLSGSKGNIKQ